MIGLGSARSQLSQTKGKALLSFPAVTKATKSLTTCWGASPIQANGLSRLLGSFCEDLLNGAGFCMVEGRWFWNF